MGKQIVKPGGALEIPTAEDIIQPVHDRLLASLGKSARFNRDVVTLNADAAGNFQLQSGPADGFLWAVMLVAVDPGNGTATWTLFVNNTSPSSAVCNLQTGRFVLPFSKSQLILKNNDKLILASTAVGAPNLPVAFAVHAIEVPIQHEAQLLL